jgi:YggT family protein
MELARLLSTTLLTFINIYTALLFIRILLTWFPNINWFDPPFSVLSQLTDPYLNIFRSIIPPLGGIDFSPILALLLLQVLQSVIPQVAQVIAITPNSFGI